MLTSNDIQGLLAKGEHLSLECKLCANKLPNSLWDTYSAFANSYGGYILLGIEEHREETVVKLPIESVYHGGLSRARNPHMQNMLRMIGYGLRIYKSTSLNLPLAG